MSTAGGCISSHGKQLVWIEVPNGEMSRCVCNPFFLIFMLMEVKREAAGVHRAEVRWGDLTIRARRLGTSPSSELLERQWNDPPSEKLLECPARLRRFCLPTTVGVQFSIMHMDNDVSPLPIFRLLRPSDNFRHGLLTNEKSRMFSPATLPDALRFQEHTEVTTPAYNGYGNEDDLYAMGLSLEPLTKEVNHEEYERCVQVALQRLAPLQTACCMYYGKQTKTTCVSASSCTTMR